MRITGGKYLNRTILFPKSGPGGDIRPSMDRMRQSVFNILGDLTGRSFLDLFAGSGIIGLEAASRGAAPVILVEKDKRKRETILKNMAWVETDIKLYSVPVESYIARCSAGDDDKNSRVFDVIFLDPPFGYGYKEDLVGRVASGRLLTEHGLLIIHHPKQEAWPTAIGKPGECMLSKTDERHYGQSVVDMYKPAHP